MSKKLALPLITFVAGLLVAGFYYLLQEPMLIARQQREEELKKRFFPEGVFFENKDDRFIIVKNQEKREIGFITQGESLQGYGGKIKVLVALDLDWSIKDYVMTEHNETPGLGTQVNEEWFKQGFLGKRAVSVLLPESKADFRQKLGIDAVSGATISSLAIVQAIGNAGDSYAEWWFKKTWDIILEEYEKKYKQDMAEQAKYYRWKQMQEQQQQQQQDSQ